ncbi:MAG: hypothetical protein HC817_03995 [Saprospiraceae bacterium]|nr:hypothetical protein [Saprospiraceae bacterium]
MKVILLYISCLPFLLNAQNIVNNTCVIRDTTKGIQMTDCGCSSIFRDSTCQFNFDDAIKRPFEPINRADIRLQNPVSVWLRFKVQNADSVSILRFVTVYQRNTERVKLFVVDENQRVDSFATVGCDFPYDKQNRLTLTPSFHVQLAAKKHYTLYLNIIQKDQSLKTSIHFRPIEAAIQLKDSARFGFVVGLSFFYMCVALGMFLFMKTRLYFAYFFHVLGSLGYLMATKGLGFMYIWSVFPVFEGASEVIFASLSFSGFLLFSVYFFDTPQYFPKLDIVLKAIISIGFIEIMAGLFRKLLPLGTYALVSGLSALSLILGLIIVGFISVWSYFLFKKKETFYFVLSFVVFILTAILIILNEIGYTYWRYLAHDVMPNVSLFYEFSALMIILAYRIKERWITQQLREHQLQQNLMEQRQQISRDLHDEVGSTLTSISVFSEIAMQQSPLAMPVLKRIGDASRSLIDSINDIVWVTNPKNDKFEDITLRMRLFAADLLMPKNVNIYFNFDPELDKIELTVEQRKHFYLVFKEVINNIFKYAVCNTVDIHIEKSESSIKMNISDNGIGFDVLNPKNGNGLKTMRERAEILRGAS